MAKARPLIILFGLLSIFPPVPSVALGQSHPHAGHHGTMMNETKATSPKDPKDTPYSDVTTGLPEAKPMEIIELKDGDRLTLTASPVKQKVDGKWIRRLAYNGQIPGPVLKAKQGSTVRILLKNETEVDTTLHPHGLRIDTKNDGMPGISQPPIAPGKSHEYVLRFPDAGIFWYHPHVREDYTQDAGLYGNFWVVPKDPGFYNPVHREIPLILDDIALKDPQAYYKDRVTHTLMGRFGNVMLINGSDDFKLKATTGEVLRFFITNTSNTRVYEFAIPGVPIKLVGSDNGLYERETWAESVTISPSERYILEVKLPRSGTFEMVNDKPSGPVRLGSIEVAKGSVSALKGDFNRLRTPVLAQKELRAVKEKLNIPVSHTLRLTLAMDHASLPMSHGGHGSHQMAKHDSPKPASKAKKGVDRRSIEWDDEMASMNLASNDRNVVWKLVDEKTKKENMAIDWTFKKGDFVKIRIVNDPNSMHPMQHPIHFHGQRFVVSAVDGKPTENLVWKDSVLVASGETVDIVLEASSAGQWMAHCHIAEHLGAGMMLGFNVLD